MNHDPGRAVARTIDAIWRIESPKIVATVTRMFRGDVGLAEDLAQDALIAAIEHWPGDGIPSNPGAWLMTTAKNRALDRLRQDKLHAEKQGELGADADARGDHVVPDFSDALDERDDIGDDLLRLIFTACHPVLSREAQVALTLKLLGGLSTAEIARAFLVPEPTIAQRIVRAKRTLGEAKLPYEVPRGEALAPRLAPVLEVLYLIFNEGYSATAGDDWVRPALCEEAMRMGRVLVALVAGPTAAPGVAPAAQREALGLLALMEIQASRLRARTDAAGQPILLLEQDRGRWDRLLIGRGLAALAQAQALDGGASGASGASGAGSAGPYELQAAIAACHARAPTADRTDWRRIVALYELLFTRTPSPVIALNHAVAVGMAFGPAAALPRVEALVAEGSLAKYHLLDAVRGDLLGKLGRLSEAREAFEAAAALTANERERALLLARARATLS